MEKNIKHSANAQLKQTKKQIFILSEIVGILDLIPDAKNMSEFRNALNALNKSFHEFNAYSNNYKKIIESKNDE